MTLLKPPALVVRISMVLSLLVLSLVGSATRAEALVIRHANTDIADSGDGDRWRSQFTIEDSSFTAGQGFSILFDPMNYFSLAAPTFAGPDWDLIAIQPDALLPAVGAFDGLALVSSPDLSGPFEIEYTWLGVGSPTDFAFLYYDTNFQTLGTGVTIPVPEPGTLMLILLGLVPLSARRRRRSTSTFGILGAN